MAPAGLKAQTLAVLDAEFGLRGTVSVDKKVRKGLHVYLEEEVRIDNNFTKFDRLKTTLGVKYKIHPNIKVGMGYSLINGYSSEASSFKNARHRLMVDVTGTLFLGDFNLSLKERFQVTRRTGDFNVYQNPRNTLDLKSRLTLKYKGFFHMDPYAFVEVRNRLNAPVVEAAYDGTTYYTLDGYSDTGEPGWFLKGFNGSYVSRLRSSVGFDLKFNQHHSVNVYYIFDYVIDKVVDANSEGTQLKSFVINMNWCGWIGAEYKFSF